MLALQIDQLSNPDVRLDHNVMDAPEHAFSGYRIALHIKFGDTVRQKGKVPKWQISNP